MARYVILIYMVKINVLIFRLLSILFSFHFYSKSNVESFMPSKTRPTTPSTGQNTRNVSTYFFNLLVICLPNKKKTLFFYLSYSLYLNPKKLPIICTTRLHTLFLSYAALKKSCSTSQRVTTKKKAHVPFLLRFSSFILIFLF